MAAALAAGQDAAASSMPQFSLRAYTVSDDDIQQPPQQLQRLVAQQQQLSLQLQQAQQQGMAAMAASRQQQQQQPGEVFGPWSAPAAARLTGQSSLSSVGSERALAEQYSAAGAGVGPGSSLGPSPQPLAMHLQGTTAAAGAEDGGGDSTLQALPSSFQQQQLGAGAMLTAQQQAQQPSGRGTPLTSSAGVQHLLSAGGAAQAAAAAAAIAAAGAATAVAAPGESSGVTTPGGWSSIGGAGGSSAVTSAAGAPGSGVTSGYGAAGGSAATAAGSSVAAHPQLLAMVNQPWAGSGAGARNWELFSGAAELEERLGKVSERMQEMGFSEQRIKVCVERRGVGTRSHRVAVLGRGALMQAVPSERLTVCFPQRQGSAEYSGWSATKTPMIAGRS